MRLSDLRDKMVRTLDGERLGRVHEVHCDKGRVTAIMCGPASLIERWTGKRDGHRISWERIAKVTDKHILVAPDPPKQRPKSGAARIRQDTRQASARPSRR